jgi:hypothetical protein
MISPQEIFCILPLVTGKFNKINIYKYRTLQDILYISRQNGWFVMQFIKKYSPQPGCKFYTEFTAITGWINTGNYYKLLLYSIIIIFSSD